MSLFAVTNADCCITSPPSLVVVDVVIVVVCHPRCSSSLLFAVAVVRCRRCCSLSLLFIVGVVRLCCSSSSSITILRRLSGCAESQEREQNKDVVAACGGGVDVNCQ